MSVDIVYLHFSKAFDKIPVRRLLNKCEGLGITGMGSSQNSLMIPSGPGRLWQKRTRKSFRKDCTS